MKSRIRTEAYSLRDVSVGLSHRGKCSVDRRLDRMVIIGHIMSFFDRLALLLTFANSRRFVVSTAYIQVGHVTGQ